MSIRITYFVHGTTRDNELDLASGWADAELSDLGVVQAKELGQQAKDKSFSIVFCSDLRRAAESARLAFGETHSIIQDNRLREVNYGDYTQRPSKEVKADLTGYVDTPFPNGESYRDVEKRVKDFLKDLIKNFSNEHIAIVAHQAPQLALEVICRGRTWAQAIAEDWRHTKAWQPGWEYILEEREDEVVFDGEEI